MQNRVLFGTSGGSICRQSFNLMQADKIMALLDLARTRGQNSSQADRLRSRVVDVLGAIADWNDRRRTRKVLSQLSAHELNDIGLSEADIDFMSRKSSL